jgi:hypothetical protein
LLLEISGWVAGANHDLPWATLLIAAAAAVSRDIGAPLHPSDLGEFHNECERSAATNWALRDLTPRGAGAAL